LQIIYGAFVGLIFAPQVNILSIYSTPELALLLGNIFSYIVSPKGKYVLKLKEKIQIAPDVYDFAFALDKSIKFRPGQYLEWTLAHEKPDNRGNRRYFTISSSPLEQDLKIGVKFYENSSSFKKALLSMQAGDEIVASQLAGDFVLPKNNKKKLVFIAGGIGITPFRSMIKYLVEKNEKRDITLFFSNRNASGIVYQDVFLQAKEQLGITPVYSISDLTGPITKEMIIKEVPDYIERIFYLSGPRGMVLAFKNILNEIGVSKTHIKTDFFPGLV
jgi:ferredoxin-NADP reductase